MRLLPLAAIALAATATHAQNLVSCDFGGNLRRMNTTTGAGTSLFSVGADGNGMLGLTLGPGGDYYYLRTFNQPAGGLWRINHSTGAATRLMDVFGSFGEGDLRYNPATSTMYVVGELSLGGRLARLDMTTGEITSLNGTTMGDPSGIAFSPAGDMYIYDTAHQGFQHNPAIKRINPANGQVLSTTMLTIGGITATTLGDVGGIEFDPSGTLHFVDGGQNGAHLWTINTATGALTDIGPSGIVSGMTGLVFDPIPAPTTSLTLAILALPALRRRRLV
jgi:DNA-binding beta-propeller fold protein YncE